MLVVDASGVVRAVQLGYCVAAAGQDGDAGRETVGRIMKSSELDSHIQRMLLGGNCKYHEKNASQGKLFAREHVRRLLDEGSFTEDGLFANTISDDLPADAVVTGLGRIFGRPVAVMANDSTVKAGSWGQRTVEKILRIQETALRLEVPLFFLVDSAGARSITDQVELLAGRRGAGRIFYNQVALSGRVPQISLLFGPSAAGGAYIPAFCDVVIMVDGNASVFLLRFASHGGNGHGRESHTRGNG